MVACETYESGKRESGKDGPAKAGGKCDNQLPGEKGAISDVLTFTKGEKAVSEAGTAKLEFWSDPFKNTKNGELAPCSRGGHCGTWPRNRVSSRRGGRSWHPWPSSPPCLWRAQRARDVCERVKQRIYWRCRCQGPGSRCGQMRADERPRSKIWAKKGRSHYRVAHAA